MKFRCRDVLLGPIAALALVVASRGGTPAGWHVEGGARTVFDTNVFLQDGGPLVAGATATAPAQEAAWVSSLAAGIAWSGAGPVDAWEIGYRAEVFRYTRFASENHDDHRLRLMWNRPSGAVAWEAAALASWTNGADLAPLYNVVGGAPALGSEPVRARRAQALVKGSFRGTATHRGGWWRVLGAGLGQDFHTGFASGCASYVDRAEYWLGAEAAREWKPGFAGVVGLRIGRQTQGDRPPAVGLHSTSALLRVLAGVEGKLTPQWKIDLRAGPDFRRFDGAEPAALARERTAPFVEATVAWTPGSADAVTLTGLHRLWPASGGRGVYEDSTWELGWKHKLSAAWAARVAQKLADGDNHHDAYAATKPWHDQILTTTCAVEYRLSPATLLDLSLVREIGEGLIPNTPGRAYHRTMCSVGVSGTW